MAYHPPLTLPVSDALRTAVSSLHVVNPWVGLWRFISLGFLVFTTVGLVWSTSSPFLFVGYTAIAAIVYAFWLICTHDATHRTLTGWTIDPWLARIISYPVAWPYETYAQLHRLHHAWNGINLQDPERVQWTTTEYEHASQLQRWYVQHQWFIDIFIFGGLGLIVKMVYKSLQLRHQFPHLSQALLQDAVSISLVQTSLAATAFFYGHGVQYLIFWLILERITGILLQSRDHLEHYGLWRSAQNHRLSQLYACRNLSTPSGIAWLMGGLNNHAVHHAFPNLPFNRLPEAFDRIQTVLREHQQPEMHRDGGYVHELFRLSGRSLLIED